MPDAEAVVKHIPYWKCVETTDPESGEEVVDVYETGIHVEGFDGKVYIAFDIPDKVSAVA